MPRLIDVGLSYDDVLLQPKLGVVSKRSEVDLTTRLMPDYPLTVPIVSAPMSTVTTGAMAKAMYEAGGTGIIHRFMSFAEQHLEFTEAEHPVWCAIGINEGMGRVEALLKAGCHDFCIDVAHAHHERVGDFIRELRSAHVGIGLMAGNVATYDGARFLADLGVDSIKVGIGPGSACTTRIKTGHGTPQFTAVMEAAAGVEGYPTTVVADGGIRSSGDIVKAIAAGADAVMLGWLLAGASEAPHPGVYFGMASERAMEEGGKDGGAEGVEGTVEVAGSVADIVTELAKGIRSGVSYAGGRSLSDIKGKADYYMVSPAVAEESRARI